MQCISIQISHDTSIGHWLENCGGDQCLTGLTSHVPPSALVMNVKKPTTCNGPNTPSSSTTYNDNSPASDPKDCFGLPRHSLMISCPSFWRLEFIVRNRSFRLLLQCQSTHHPWVMQGSQGPNLGKEGIALAAMKDLLPFVAILLAPLSNAWYHPCPTTPKRPDAQYKGLMILLRNI